MRKKLFTLAILSIVIFAVSAMASAKAGSAPERDRSCLLQVGCTSGTFLGIPQGNPQIATVYDVTFWGTGTVSGMGKVTVTGTELDVFNSPPPTFTHLELMGTATLTDKAGDTLTFTYQCSQGTASSPYQGTYKIIGGTGQFWDAVGGGLAWGTDSVTSPPYGVWTMNILGVISF